MDQSDASNLRIESLVLASEREQLVRQYQAGPSHCVEHRVPATRGQDVRAPESFHGNITSPDIPGCSSPDLLSNRTLIPNTRLIRSSRVCALRAANVVPASAS